MDELYDLETDPFEMQNLIDTDRGRAVLPELTAELGRGQAEAEELGRAEQLARAQWFEAQERRGQAEIRLARVAQEIHEASLELVTLWDTE